MKRFFYILTAVVGLAVFTGCQSNLTDYVRMDSEEVLTAAPKQPFNKDTFEIEQFRYDFGSFFGGYWAYTITRREDTYYFSAEGMNGVDLSIQDEPIDGQYIEELEALIADEKIDRWNGFSAFNRNVLDGYGFEIYIESADGYTLSADAYETYLRNYQEIHNKLAALLTRIEKDVVIEKDVMTERLGADGRTLMTGDTPVTIVWRDSTLERKTRGGTIPNFV